MNSISMASHELKTPITSVRLFTEILQKMLKEKTMVNLSRYVESMHVQLEKLTRLISDLLDVSKIQAGKLELAPVEFSLKELVTETANTIRFISQHHTIVINADAEYTIRADRERIGQVLVNLLTNANQICRAQKKS